MRIQTNTKPFALTMVFGLLGSISLVWAAAGILPAASGNVEFTLPKAGRVSLAVYQPKTGQQLRELLRAELMEAGKHRVAWDGLDHRGKPVPPGTVSSTHLTLPTILLV